MSNYAILCLLLVTLTQAQVDIYPSGVIVSYPGGHAKFQCTSAPGVLRQTIDQVTWRANETVLTGQEDYILTEFTRISGGIGGLTLSNISDYFNNTEISCEALLDSGQKFISNTATILVLQGPLDPVVNPNVNAVNSTFILTWDPPFSLDIIGINPDIEGYCVFAEVRDSSSRSTFFTLCGINKTEVTIPMPERPNAGCDRYIFTITAVNIVGNGTLSRIPAMEMMMPNLLEFVFYGSNNAEESNSFTLALTMSAAVCCAQLKFKDNDTADTVVVECEDLTIMDNIITLVSTQLRMNRYYLVTVAVDNRAGRANSTIDISTHGIMGAVVRNTGGDQIELETSYFTYSSASGVLYRLLHLTGDGHINYSLSSIVVLSRSVNSSNVTALPGVYVVLGYDIEQGGKLLSGVAYPAVIREFVKTGNDSQGTTSPPLLSDTEDCTISVNQSFIEAQCTYPMSTGFQMIAYLTSSSGHRIYVEQTTHTTATVEVEETGVYQVSIFPLREGTGILDSNVEYTQQVMVSDLPTAKTPTDRGLSEAPGDSNAGTIAGAVVGVGVLVIIITILIVVIVIMVRRRSHSGSSKITRRDKSKRNRTVHMQEEEGGARTAISDQFPLLPAKDSQRCDLLYEEYGSLSAFFEDLVSRTEQFLQNSCYTGNDLIIFFQSKSKLTELANSINHSDSIPEVMNKVRKGGYLNYEVLESLIRHFDREGAITQDLDEYISRFQEYIKRRVCEVPMDAFDNSGTSFPGFAVMLDNHFSVSISLSKVKQLQHRIEQILNLKSIFLTGVHVNDGCLQLCFSSFNILSSVSEEQRASLKDIGVLSSTLSEAQNSSFTALMFASSSTSGTATNPAATITDASATITDASATKSGPCTIGSAPASVVASIPDPPTSLVGPGVKATTPDVKADQKVSPEAKPSQQPVEVPKPNKVYFVPSNEPTKNRKPEVSDGGIVIMPMASDQASTGVKFKVVNTDTPEPTSATPEPASATPEPPEVPSVNKFFAKPYEETARRSGLPMPQLQTSRTEGAMGGGQSPPTPEPGQTVSNKDFSKEYPSMGAGAGEIVEQDSVPMSPTTRQNSEAEVPPITLTQLDPINVQPSSPTTSEPSSMQDLPASGHGESMPPVAISSSEASEDSDSTASGTSIVLPKSPTLLKDQD